MPISKVCPRTGASFDIGDDDLSFYKKISPIFAGHCYDIPPPTLCPEARLQRRLAFRNERCLYRKRSCLGGAEVITIFAPDSPYKITTYEEWWGDGWDPLSFGRDYDPNRGFAEQLHELSLAVPHCPLYIRNSVNSDYTNYALNMKDCYLVFGATDCERCLFSKAVSNCRDVVDCLALRHSELCYEGTASERCYSCQFFSNCADCVDCFMVEACESCNHCALCFGLHRKEYCLLNEYVGKTRYEEFMQSLQPMTPASVAALRDRLDELARNLPHRQSYIQSSENCDGDNISHSRNCFSCFDITQCEDSKFLFWTPKGITSYDCCFNAPDGVELCYETCSTLGSRCMGTFMSWNNDQAYYCLECHYSKNLFACVGLRHKQYCILNQQYSAEEYEALVPKIIEAMGRQGLWGEYLPAQCSYFGYNETIANEYYPRSTAQARSEGFLWREDPGERTSEESAYLPSRSPRELTDSLCSEILRCAKSGKPFKITPLELSFYKKMGLPPPDLCPDARHMERIKRRNEMKLWPRHCAKTGEQIWTGFPPSAPFPVYSNQAYAAEVY